MAKTKQLDHMRSVLLDSASDNHIRALKEHIKLIEEERDLFHHQVLKLQTENRGLYAKLEVAKVASEFNSMEGSDGTTRICHGDGVGSCVGDAVTNQLRAMQSDQEPG